MMLDLGNCPYCGQQPTAGHVTALPSERKFYRVWCCYMRCEGKPAIKADTAAEAATLWNTQARGLAMGPVPAPEYVERD